MIRIVGTSIVLALLAGCADAPAASTLEASVPREARVTSIAFEVKGTFFAWNAAPNGGNVKVEDNATLLLMEARWTCPAGPCDLTLLLIPKGGTRESSTGTNQGTHSIEDPERGTWNAQVRPASATVGATGEIRVTAFYGPVPPGYTAFVSSTSAAFTADHLDLHTDGPA